MAENAEAVQRGRRGDTELSKTPATGIMYKVRIIDRTIWRLEIKRDSLKSCLLPGSVRYDLDKVQTSPEDRFSLVMAEVADLDSTIQELKRAKAEAIMDISAKIELVSDERERVILTAYYIGGIPMTRIAEQIGYSLPHTYRLRRSGETHVEREHDNNDN